MTSQRTSRALSVGEDRASGVEVPWSLRCQLFGHAFYWMDVNHRHHCRRCGATDLRYVLQNRRIHQINSRFGCDCPECVIPSTPLTPHSNRTVRYSLAALAFLVLTICAGLAFIPALTERLQ